MSRFRLREVKNHPDPVWAPPRINGDPLECLNHTWQAMKSACSSLQPYSHNTLASLTDDKRHVIAFGKLAMQLQRYRKKVQQFHRNNMDCYGHRCTQCFFALLQIHWQCKLHSIDIENWKFVRTKYDCLFRYIFTVDGLWDSSTEPPNNRAIEPHPLDRANQPIERNMDAICPHAIFRQFSFFNSLKKLTTDRQHIMTIAWHCHDILTLDKNRYHAD